MANTTEHIRIIRLRLIAEAPPQEHQGLQTEFGLQDKEQALHPGREQADGTLCFDFEVPAKRNPVTGAVRFSGPYVQGKPDDPFIYLSWKYEGVPPQWIRRQKIRLDTIDWDGIEAAEQKGAVFQAVVPSITVRSASVPVEWESLSP